MSILLERYFNKVFFIACFIVFVVICLRAFFIPFSHDESLTFFFYIQTGNFLPYQAHVYTNNHVLNSALAHFCYKIFGSHPFVLRLPNILSFIILCFGVFKYFKHLNNVYSKLILTTLMILTFNFLDFFELCRGYGISISFMLLGLAYLQDYFKEKKLFFLALFIICLQLALAANLILVVVLPILLVFIVCFQLKNKLFFNLINIILLIVNIRLLYYWIKFSFFYKEAGSLDSGIGDDYWVVSFKSLILLIFGTDDLWIQITIISLFLIILFISSFIYFKKQFNFDSIFKPQFFYLISLSVLILAFYLQKKLLHVNYPEDRTGVFFYLFFALCITFFFEIIPGIYSAFFGTTLFIVSISYFVFFFNLTSFSFWFYHVIPEKFYAYLQNENKHKSSMFTIGGLPFSEMNYTFLNYREHSSLNAMDNGGSMQMNCDYYIAQQHEKPYYRNFYDEIDTDDKWGMVLLKRKQKIERIEQTKLTVSFAEFKGKNEWFELFKFNDSILIAKNCIEADVTINFKNVPKPFNALLVFQINDTLDKTITYKKIPLNWIADDLNGLSHRFKIISGPLPEKFGNANVHIWNVDKKELEFSISNLKIIELKAPGINVVIPKSFYSLIKGTSKQRLL